MRSHEQLSDQIDPACSSWLPAFPLPEPAPAPRPTSTRSVQPNSSMQQHGTGLSSRLYMQKAPAPSHRLSQQHDQESVCPSSDCTRPQADRRNLQPAASPAAAAANASPDAQGSQANSVLTPLSSSSASAEAQQTYSRRRHNDGSAGGRPLRSRAEDYAWLQGAEETPAAESQPIRQGLLWWNSEAGQSDEDQASSKGCNAGTGMSSTDSASHQETLVR